MHMIMEKMPANLNTEAEMENLFHKILPSKMKSLSKWKSVDIQRISYNDEGVKKLSSYLGKERKNSHISVDALNSDTTRTSSGQ